MSAFIPPPRHPRRPHLPSPRLEIPSASSGPSSSGIRTPSSSSDDGTGSSSAGSSTAQIPARARAGRPRLSLPSTSTTSRSDIHAGPAGLEHLSLDEGDRTMRPGEMQSPIPPISRPPPSNKPKLGLQTSRTPSPMPALSGPSDSNNYTSSVSLASDSMVRSTSFEGALFAETSQANIRGDEYRLSPDTLEDLGRLGEGASGEVRKVLHAPSGTVMAKKTIPASPNEDVQKQILRELAFNRECRADFITRYYGAFLEDSDSQIAICMEYCEGGSLDAIYRRIKERQGRTGEKVLGKVAEAVLHGLVYLHEHKIIHRDIKPSNILVARSGLIKLCDFGISGELINSMAGTFCGTSYYMAPERIRGSRYTITADIWSLGLTIHEVAMSRFPFPPEGEPPLGPIELLSYIIHMETPILTDEPGQGVKWTRAIQDFTRLCLEKDPAKRPNPAQLLQHNWIKKSVGWHPDLAAWVAQVWDW
ncbi:MAG: Protein kinase C signaling pathway involved MAPKK protein [Cyphobasidiales sp. Tagirdzhanova-0007]|nr:MAG: Protein kinase C signaling pathway involved MAPKK protein [Cyphobasidiales sp. Tagirdzhanova-0007]